MLDIIVEERREDYIAFIYGNREVWECGKTNAEAIGKLIISLYRNGNPSVILTVRESE